MEVILLEPIESLGTVGETVKVKAGYARNYLLPKKLACLATEKNKNFYSGLIKARQRKLARDKEAAETQAAQLSQLSLVFTRKSRDEEARLFGSVTTADIAEALEEKGFEIDRKKIVLSEPIKKLGEYKAGVRLHPEVVAELNILVQPEDEPAGTGEAKAEDAD